jgi:biopolymer transport protein ExbD
MAGVDVGGGGGSGRRSVDQEINMIPFIDLLMVTISFLLITAVWTSMGRIDAHATLPGKDGATPTKPKKEPAVLHVRASARDAKFLLQWQQGTKVEDVASVDMEEDAGGRYAKLEAAIAKAYAAGRDAEHGLVGDEISWRAGDEAEHARRNTVILHVDNAWKLREVVHVMDAIATPKRLACDAPAPECCGAPTAKGSKGSGDGCARAAAVVPAFDVVMASAS